MFSSSLHQNNIFIFRLFLENFYLDYCIRCFRRIWYTNFDNLTQSTHIHLEVRQIIINQNHYIINSYKFIKSKLKNKTVTTDQIPLNRLSSYFVKIKKKRVLPLQKSQNSSYFTQNRMEIQKSSNNSQENIPPNSSVFIWGMFYDQQHKIFIPTKVKQLQNKDIVEVKSGGFFYLAKSRDGKIYGWGTTKYAKYGFTGEDTQIPRLIPFSNKVKLIAAGNWHSLLVNYNGDLYAVGHNKYGSCGNGNFQNLNQFTRSDLKQKVIKIAAGDGVSLMITQNSDIYSCGHRQRHGHKSKDHVSKPTKLKFNEKIKAVAAGFTHCLAVDEKGKIYSWGNGTFFQLGHGKKDDQKQPRLIQTLSNVFIVDISCTRGQKYAHSMALDNNGNLYTWGAGYKGKLGHFQEWDHSDPADQPLPKKVILEYKVTKCCAGGIHSMILNQNKEALSFGCGSDGRIGHQESKDHRYLYREGKPRKLQTLNGWNVQGLECSYYHNICLAYKSK